jgi:hypothetical protein
MMPPIVAGWTDDPKQKNALATLAYQRGEDAAKRGEISWFEYQVYRLLVQQSRKHGVAWPKETWLAEQLHVKVRAIQRAIAHILKAALIVRVRRGLGHSTLTYITAFLSMVKGTAHQPALIVSDECTSEALPCAELACPEASHVTHPEASHVAPVKIPEVKIPEGKEAQAPPTPHRGERRRQHPKGTRRLDGVSVTDTIASATRGLVEVPVTPATELLRDVGVQSPQALERLADTPVDEIRAAIEESERRGNVWSLPGWLVRVLTPGGGGLWGKGRRKGQGAKEPTIEELAKDCCAVCGQRTLGTCRCWTPWVPEATPEPQPAPFVLDGYCEVCCLPTFGNCGHEDRIWHQGVPPGGDGLSRQNSAISRQNDATEGTP